MMVTDTIFACYVEIGDFIALKGEAWRVTDITDTYEDNIFFDLVDADNEERINGKPFAPFANVAVVISFEDSLDTEPVDEYL